MVADSSMRDPVQTAEFVVNIIAVPNYYFRHVF